MPIEIERSQQWTEISASGQQYIISLALPAGPPPKDGYPVITLLDPQWSFSTLVETMRAQQPLLEEAVIVGVGYPLNQGGRRQFDLTMPVPRSTLPTNRFDAPYGPIGGADGFLDFLAGDLRKAVAARVPIDTSQQALFGHSLGGLFVLHALFTHPDTFQSYVAASPSIWWGDRAILVEMERYLRRASPHDSSRRLLLTVGGSEQTVQPIEDELAAHSGKPQDAAALVAMNRCYIKEFQEVVSVRYLASRLILASPKALTTSFVEFPGEVHMSVIPSYLSRGLRFALSSASFPGDQVTPSATAILPKMNLAACAPALPIPSP